MTQSAKSAQRRRRISAVATQQIIEHGFENLSVSDLAAAVGISVGGMYRYITSKTDLLVMACEDIYEGVRDELGGISTGSEPISDRLEAAVTAYMTVCVSRRDKISMVYHEYRRLPEDAQQIYKEREQAIINIFADLVRTGVRNGDFRQVDAKVVAIDIVFLGHLPSFKRWALGQSIDSEAFCRGQADLVLAGLRIPPSV